MRATLIAFSLIASLATGCMTDELGEEEAGDGALADSEAYESDGKSDAAFDALSAELKAKYGLRPRRYNGFFNNSNNAELRFTTALPRITADMNARAQGRGLPIRFTEAELAINFITEGGFYVLDEDIADSSDGLLLDAFTYFGCDTAADNATAISPWLSTSMRALLADPGHRIQQVNELGQTVNTVWVDTLEQGLELNAAMFAWSRQLAAAEIARKGTSWDKVVPEARFFWSTMWFNAGPGFGQRQLAAHGVSYWKTKWTSADDPSMSRYARYNALWRTSSWEFMTRTLQETSQTP